MLASSLARVRGALGTVGGAGIRAPKPAVDSLESPIMLNAITLARTGFPVVRLNGDALSTEAGMVHVLPEITDELLTPSQYAVSSCKVLDEVST